MMIPASCRRVCRRSVLSAVLLIGSFMPGEALAQSGSAPDAPRLVLGAGGGAVQPLHADLDFVAPFWEVSVRGRLSRRVAIEAAAGQWRRHEGFEHEVALPGQPGSTGRLSQQTTRKGRSFEVNLVVLNRFGRVTMLAGGGGGALSWRRDLEQSVTGCVDAGVPPCGRSRSSTSTASAALIGLAGTEVAATDLVSIYGQFKFIGPTRDFGSSELRYSAGVRIAVSR